MPPTLTPVVVELEAPSEFWFVFWLRFPLLLTAACPLVFPVFPTALMIVVGLSANAGHTTSIKVATVAADSHNIRITASPQWMAQRGLTLAVSVMLTARAKD